MIKQKYSRVLIAPLDWGLGHATRCVPIINKLLDKGITPVIAAYGTPLKYFRLEFPELEIIELPGLQIEYPSNYSIMLKATLTFPGIAWAFFKEHIMLKQIVEDYKIDCVVSDGRYGLWYRRIKSIFINHQINIKLPGIFSVFEYPLYLFNRAAMAMFDEVWVPDINGKPNLAGKLSGKHRLSSRYKFVGPLSRLNCINKDGGELIGDMLIVLSGPEPTRTEFEEMIFDQLHNETERKIIIVRGKPGETEFQINLPKNITIENHLSANELSKIINNTKLVICRPGYSTIMDLAMFGKKAVFVPTPGQSEQEYLARYYQKIGWAPFYKQEEFDLLSAIGRIEKYTGIPKIDKTFSASVFL